MAKGWRNRRNRSKTWDDVLRIRKWWAEFQAVLSIKAMARREGLSQSALRDIAEGRTYRHPPEEVEIDELVKTVTNHGFTGNENEETAAVR